MSYNVQPLRTQQEINDFLFCLRRNKNAERDVFLFLIGINSGLRMSDIVKLKKKDVISSKNPRIVEQKTGKTRILYLSSLQELIQDYTKDLGPEDYLFPSTKGGHLEVNTVYQMFQKVAALLDRDDIGTHTLRKTIRKPKMWLHLWKYLVTAAKKLPSAISGSMKMKLAKLCLTLG